MVNRHSKKSELQSLPQKLFPKCTSLPSGLKGIAQFAGKTTNVIGNELAALA